jgi:predicted metal-dependent hydrolase
MDRKSTRIKVLIDSCRGQRGDPRYLGYFECFNRQLFFEAHEVLEALWLPQRKGANGAFYKGLIQLAGAFVHLQKNRLHPAAALFRLAEGNLRGYPTRHEKLDLVGVLTLIRAWLLEIERGDYAVNPLGLSKPPMLVLLNDHCGPQPGS